MKVEVLYFAIAREIAGRSSESLNLADGATLADLLQMIGEHYPRLANSRSTRLMLNQRYANLETVLADGDEVAVIPPVSGGDGRFAITDQVLDPQAIERLVLRGSDGAVVTFTGVVRDHARGRSVIALEYEAYESAAVQILEQIGSEIESQWPGGLAAIVHRTGRLAVGEASVVIAVASPHRAEAFDGCCYAIERIKELLPVWKKEFYEGGSIWVGSEIEYQQEQREQREATG